MKVFGFQRNIVYSIDQRIMCQRRRSEMKSGGAENNKHLFFEIDVNSGWIFCELWSGEVNIPKATTHRDWK